VKKVNIEPSWFDLLNDEFEKDYFLMLKKFIISEYKAKEIFPPPKLIFNAFNLTPVNKVKVVVIGQDPYHGLNQAHGLAFSVQNKVKIPPSLKNIYKELYADLHIKRDSGCLENWANQGVLLLNSVLTVQSGIANSHKNKGWEQFTESVISKISEKKKNIVFLLWGSYAQKKENHIFKNDHLILKCVHPSPLSAYNGFFGSKPFSKINSFLNKHNIKEIVW